MYLVLAERVTDSGNLGETITVYSIGAITCESHDYLTLFLQVVQLLVPYLEHL